jgi:hypothetical protein
MPNPSKAPRTKAKKFNTSGPWAGTQSITVRNKKFLIAPTSTMRVQLLDLPTQDGKLFRHFKDKSVQWFSPMDFKDKRAAFRYADKLDQSGNGLPGIGYHKNTYFVYRRSTP